jgi:hypothetical protein
MAARVRFQRSKHQVIGPWPEDAPSPESIARRVVFVGSAEHIPGPRLRSNATPCDPEQDPRRFREITRALRGAIRQGSVSRIFESGFPKYVWAWVDGRLYEARHINGPLGTYKGYRLEEWIRPQDPQGLLNEE